MSHSTDVKGLYGKPSKKKPRTRLTPAAQEEAEMEEIDEKWQHPRMNALHTALQSTNPLPNPPPLPNPATPPDVGYARDLRFEDDDEQHNMQNDGIPPNNPPPPPENLTQHISSNEYQIRRIRESQSWQKVLRPMFVAFMRCADRTSMWWNEQNWRIDWHQCPCKGSQIKAGRSVDFIDFFSREKRLVKFCACPEQVRLINMGYIGGSPKFPSIAFSIRLLRHFHELWLYTCLPIQPFCLSVDKCLDVKDPPLVVNGTNEPRLWRKPFSSAIDAYRHMIRMQDELLEKALDLTSMEKLASNCARCFGPPAPPTDLKENIEDRKDEPNVIICFDGNYQQRRHLAASQEYDDIEVRYPSLFLDPKFVDEWKPGSVRNRGVDEPLVCVLLNSQSTVHNN
ncbi:hypothetical protein DFH28DRAFT_919253 [Melampsora americana]|nr:hypothetical protein DFH28DRAFT_919253 [Melampsora americana]